MYTPGTILRLAREERRLSVSDVKYFVRIRESAIVAMENDYFERFPAEYMHVFLPVYADFLGVSHYKLAESFKVTLPEHEHLTRSLYAQTLQQIAVMQMEEEYNELHPALTAQLAKFAANHAFKVLVVLCTCILGWSVMSSGDSVFGTFFESRFVVTPEEMRGTPFVELTEVVRTSRKIPVSAAQSNNQNEYKLLMNKSLQDRVVEKQGLEEPQSTEQQMTTVHLASLFTLDLAAVSTIAVKHGSAVGYAVGDALVHAVDDLTVKDPKNIGYDASRRSVSSIAAGILTSTHEGQNTSEQREISAISELSIEQNRLPVPSSPAVALVNPEYRSLKSDAVLVEGVGSVSIRDVLAARRRVGLRLAALRSAMFLTRRFPLIETVELKSVPVVTSAEISPMKTNLSVLMGVQHVPIHGTVRHLDIAKEILKSVVIPTLPSMQQSEHTDVLPE